MYRGAAPLEAHTERFTENLVGDRQGAFTSIVTKVYAEQNGDITFCLLGELQLRMEVK